MTKLRPFVSVILVALFVCGSMVNASEKSMNRIDRFFVFGTNLAWFNNNYGADIGTNHAEGGWSPTFTQEHCETVFANLEKMGCPVLRIWAFERQEGLKFSADLSSDPDYPYHEVTGLDEEFMKNSKFLMDCAARHHVKVYWSLLNHLIREEQDGRHMRIITDPKVRSSYINNAALPFLKEFAHHPAFFAVDIMNEADGAIGGKDFLTGGMDPRIGCTWKAMRLFIKECATAFHHVIPGIKVTCTSGWHEYKNLKRGKFSGLGLDFYDWHSYKNNPDLPHARELKLDKPVIIGECGPKTQEPDKDYALQGKNWDLYLAQARKGYAGLLTWSYGDQGKESNFVMVNQNHSWRAGAKFIYKATRGSMIPDAGPLMIGKNEMQILSILNQALKQVIALGKPYSSAMNSAQKRLAWLGNETKKFFPYINPRYAVTSFIRALNQVTLVGEWELRNRPKGYVTRVFMLQQIGSELLAQSKDISFIKKYSAVSRLESFLKRSPSSR